MTKLPPIANNFALFMADQKAKEKAKRDRTLPEGLHDKGNPRVLSEQQTKDTALAYLLSDVIYQIMYNLCEQMQGAGMDLRHESKRRFNELFKSADSFKNKAMMVSRDVSLLGNDKAFDDYFHDSEWLRDVIQILYNRAHVSEDSMVKIRAMLFNMPQK